MMKRRDFLKTSAVAGLGVAAATTLAAPAIAQGKRELKLVTTWPKNFPGLGTGAQRFADRITAATDGRLTVRLFAAGELVPPFESFDAVSSGAADMYHGADYYWQGKSKAYNFYASVPMGFTATEMSAWIHHGGGQQLWDELSADFNIKPFIAGNTGVQMGGWYAKEINSLDDLKGLKIRMPGLGGEVMRQVGAAAVALPGGEIFPALQSGAIDATEWVGPWNDLAFGFYKIVKNYYYPGFHETGTALTVGVNRQLFESLSPSDRTVIELAALAENDYTLAEFNANNGRALVELLTKHDVKLHKFSDEIWKQFGIAAEQVISDAAKDGGITAKVTDSFRAFRKDVAGWTRLSDQAYTNMRDLVLPG